MQKRSICVLALKTQNGKCVLSFYSTIVFPTSFFSIIRFLSNFIDQTNILMKIISILGILINRPKLRMNSSLSINLIYTFEKNSKILYPIFFKCIMAFLLFSQPSPGKEGVPVKNYG